MVTLTWLRGLIAHRPGRLLATACGVALSVALLASIGTFESATTAKMTQRAIARVPLDWQVEGRNGVAPAQLLNAVRRQPGVTRALPVSYASTTGLSTTARGSTQTTGPGRALGLPTGYARAFPGELRLLSGAANGALLAQQTAANLHAQPGDTITIGRPGGPPARVKVAGIVDLPAADSLFQQVGAPVGAQAQAPPDNVVLLPQAEFQRVMRGAPVTTQVHAQLAHNLPHSPGAAADSVAGRARNLETKLAGAGLVGDNLGTALGQARQDALYAQLLFLFLGLPGAVLAALITASIASAGGRRRRRDAALLRTRGASTNQLVRIALGEAVMAGVLGVAVGLGAALVIGRIAFSTSSFGASTSAAVAWAAGSAIAGLAVATAAIAVPAWRDARALTVAGQRAQVGRRDRAPFWSRWGLDFLCLIGAGLVFWHASRSGYQLVLAPEGVPQVSVDWSALAAPLLGWIGAGLLAYRIADLMLGRRRTLSGALRPIAGELAPMISATMGRQRSVLARAVALLALTVAFAASTGVFNATYHAQAEVDARLTNGADVTVTESPGSNVGPAGAAQLRQVRGVRSVEPLQHRFAYVGADLQDLYGVDPSTIQAAGKLQNSWFQGGSATSLMQRLQQHPDGILVSAETVKDFQLHPGDLLRLRLLDGRTKRFVTVPFHYLGVAKEFPTAPTDSFLVANARYVAKATGSDAVGSFLVQTDGTSPATVAQRVRSAVGATAQVSDIATSRRVVGSNLTAVELSGLTRVELGFALVLAAAASGLALALGLRERRRAFAIAAALGARGRQLGGFVWGESAFVTVIGIALGAVAAAAITHMLIRVLTGVFDPPPDVVTVPWRYLAIALVVTVAAVVAAGTLTLRTLRRPPVEQLREG
jgi:putative ABC transport system permease protein